MKFKHIDVYNERYDPQGKVLASDFKFPFEANSFDFVFLTSVFTHMFEKYLENYLIEIRRILKPNGRCLFTFFLLNEEAEKRVSKGKSAFTFK
ncbi:methyltransferase domain-containing protein [Mangrovimonas sp. YM274]|uniref:methyltransferase domain-containing protein n=1 Tax=Mangrovimonas sp. YM274 TaxID=3070660 RepID=UPI0035A6289A